MATRKQQAQRPPKKKPAKKDALIHFTATQKGTARPNRPRADGSDGGVWVKVMPPSWIKYTNKGVTKKTKQAAVKALKKFKKR
jgi:hypothetical protein